MICTCRVDSRKASNIFSKEDFSSISCSWYGLYEVVYCKVVDSRTRGSCIPTDSVKSSNDCPILVHSTGIGAYIE